jgi:general secretion pathway protein G
MLGRRNFSIVSRTARSRARRAFTLIELLLVLVILAVLAAVVVPKFTNRTEQAKITAAKTDISNLESSLDMFEVDNGRYPSDADGGLEALVKAPANAPNWKNPYAKRIPNDPWGNPYKYVYPGANNANGYDLSSMGPDGREGGDDIDNWSSQ